MTVRTVDHVNIATERLEDTRAFYVEVLGLVEGYRPPFGSKGYWLYAADHPVLHMQEAAGPVGPSQASALNHFAFAVADFDSMIARLDRHGVRYDLQLVPGSDVRQAFFHDPNGVRVELNACQD